jgi:hypothetical protein
MVGHAVDLAGGAIVDSVRIVLCPSKCIVAAYLFRSANTGASDSRPCNSCVGFGSFASMYTTKCVSSVNRAI